MEEADALNTILPLLATVTPNIGRDPPVTMDCATDSLVSLDYDIRSSYSTNTSILVYRLVQKMGLFC